MELYDDLDRVPGERFALPRQLIVQWRAGILTKEKARELADSFICPHKGRCVSRDLVTISREALDLLRSVFGDFPATMENDPICAACWEKGAQSRLEQLNADAMISKERKVKRMLVETPPFDADHWLLPTDWVEEWEAWLQKKGPRPGPIGGLCEHGMLESDPYMTWPKVINEKGWMELTRL